MVTTQATAPRTVRLIMRSVAITVVGWVGGQLLDCSNRFGLDRTVCIEDPLCVVAVDRVFEGQDVMVASHAAIGQVSVLDAEITGLLPELLRELGRFR